MLTGIAKGFIRQYYKTLDLQEQKQTLVENLADSNEKLNSEIYERRRMEVDLLAAKLRAEQANKSKSAFLSHLSHELRTPLNSILGFSELLEHDTNLSGHQREQMRYVYRAGNHLLDLVNDVLDLATIDSGKLSLNVVKVKMTDIVNECQALIRYLAEEKEVKLEFNTEAIEALVIEVDPKRIKQILLNLFSNAIKYNKRKGVVQFTAHVEKHCLAFSVTDTGKGISEEAMKDIFSPFDRVGQENSNIEGTGIGLTITKRLVEMMQGELEVESSEGVGTVFTVRLPIAAQINNPAGCKDLGTNNEDSAVRELQNGLVLLIEDNPANQLILKKQLGKLGFDVVCVENGRDALNKVEQHGFDLIITDCNMPEMDGYEFTQRLREKEKGTDTHCPVIAITADAYKETASRCYEVGMDAYLTKPIDFQTLKSATKQWISP
jgi:signal transduction histidine kinase/CheY-like chemotaxis protein